MRTAEQHLEDAEKKIGSNAWLNKMQWEQIKHAINEARREAIEEAAACVNHDYHSDQLQNLYYALTGKELEIKK